MTKLLTPKILLILLMSFFSTTAIAHDIEVKNADGVTIYYNWINNNTELEVSYRGGYYFSYSGEYSGKLVVPESVTYNGKMYSVTSIGNDAFYDCSSLNSITIPNSVTSIGNDAFYDCSSLTSITIPNSVTSIGGWAFEYCSGLTSITIPNSVTSIGDWAFIHCSGLTSIKVESGNTKYDSRDNCNAIIETNRNRLLAGCKNTIIPNNVTSIASAAFIGCSGLTSVTIPNSVTTIGKETFNGCSGLTSIKVESGNINYDSRNNCNAIIETASNTLIAGCKNTLIPNSVTTIGGRAFQNHSGLISISIPNSVTSIGNYAFFGCSSLTSITIPNGVTSINTWTFGYCRGLTSITIPNSVTSIGYCAFSGCSGLTSISIPNSVTTIGEETFNGCSGLTSIKVESGNTNYDSRNNCNAIIETASNTLIVGCNNTLIPNSVTTIGVRAFNDCTGLTSITIPNSVTFIGDYAFQECGGLTSIISKIQNPFVIEDNVFYCSNKDIYATATLTIPKGTKAAYQATAGWNKFANIVEEGATDEVMFTSDGVTYLGSSSNKTAVVKSVDTKLKMLEIPASVYHGVSYQVTGIADNAFSGCTMAALIWNADAALPSNAFSSASIGSNFLLYVNSASYAPSNVKNVVVDGIAQTILLSDDGGNFYCPEEFTAQSISYTHNYSMETGGNGKGWEALALPFDVKNIEHKTKGTLTPFALYDSSNSSQRPFWLYELGSSGFRRSSGIKANTPYIIAMPNNTSYDSDYILTGDVTFSASNAKVYETSSVVTATSGSKRFVPAFSAVERSSDVYTLNVSNQKVSYSGSYDKGSHFISNLRSTYPFEAYMTTSSNGTRTRSIGIEFDDDVTAIDIVPATDGETDIVKVYSMNGILVLQTDHESLQKQWESLPAGVYIVNGKKVLK